MIKTPESTTLVINTPRPYMGRGPHFPLREARPTAVSARSIEQRGLRFAAGGCAMECPVDGPPCTCW